MSSTGDRALAMEEIRNLVVQYAHAVDAGDFAAVGEYYDGARIQAFQPNGDPMGDASTRSAREMEQFYESIIVVDADGFTGTQHLISNIQVTVDDACQNATARSSFTVLQKKSTGTIEVIITGTYADKYAMRARRWKLTSRDEFISLSGDLSEHLKG